MNARAPQESPQQLPVGRAPDMQGKRIGALTVLFRCVGQRQNNAFWLCECDCGRLAVRSGPALRGNISSEACCNVCLGELRRGGAIARRPFRHETFLEMWLQHGTLYSQAHDDRVAAENIEEAGLEALPLAEQLFDVDTDWRSAIGHGGYIFPIADHEWRCVHCQELFTEGFGCTLCVEPICVSCVEGHSKDETLVSIGQYLGITRESVRQAEAKALRKLRHPSRLKFLAPFIKEDALWVRIPVMMPVLSEHCGIRLRRAGDVTYCSRCGVTGASLFKPREKNEPTETVWQKSGTGYARRSLDWLESLTETPEPGVQP